MRRVVHFVIGLLLIFSAAYLTERLVVERDLLILASVSPAILAAAAYGVLLLVRVFRSQG